MRGLDGNYLNMQGDASARIQVAYQAEQNRQQIRAQVEASEALRKLREQVNEAERKADSSGPGAIRDDRGSGSGGFFQESPMPMPRSQEEASDEKDRGETAPGAGHIDVRV